MGQSRLRFVLAIELDWRQFHQPANDRLLSRQWPTRHVCLATGNGGVITTRRISGLLIAEHLAAISVFALVIAWLSGIATFSRTQLTPLRLQVLGYQVANAALVTGQEHVMMAGDEWLVEVSDNGVKVADPAAHFTQTLRRDAD